jgi:hypothetical protein
MSKERGEELFQALHSLLDAVTNLNLGDLEAEAKAEVSSQGAGTSASASAKGKAKDPDPDWTEVPYNPVPITPLSTRPRFSQVVGSSSIVTPSQVSIKAVSLANHPAYSPAVIAAWCNDRGPLPLDHGCKTHATTLFCSRITIVIPTQPRNVRTCVTGSVSHTLGPGERKLLPRYTT